MQQPYTCMIVDDQPDAVDYMATLIDENCPCLKVIATAASSAKAKERYLKFLPDLLFLDIEIDEQNGFGIIQDIYREKLSPYIIFVTAYNQYAIEAFKTKAIDYLLKPVDAEDLKNAVARFIQLKDNENQAGRLKELIRQLPQKIRFNTRTGFILLNSNEILYCEADRNYTKIHLSNREVELISLNLAGVTEKLPDEKF
jgi:two-component system, LytTR family, response regulator